MSIIHDALKKVQQGQSPKPNSSTTSASTTPLASDYIYANPPAGAGTQEGHEPIEHLHSKQNKAKSILAFLCALAITLGAFVFLCKQVCVSFPNVKNWIEVSFSQLVHKNNLLRPKENPADNLKTLAKITVNPPQPIVPPKPITPPPSPMIHLPTIAEMIKEPDVPLTLNIHGVMSNGSGGNLVLINDQVYQEGDEVEGVKIVKINLSTITVDNNGKEEIIHVKN